MKNYNESLNHKKLENYCLVQVKTHMSTPGLTIAFKELIDNLIQKDKCRKILFDLTSVEFVDSSFIGAIVYAYKNLKQLNGKICVVIKSAAVYDRFILAQLDTLFKIYDNFNDAEKYILE